MSFEGPLIHSLQVALQSRLGVLFAVACARWLIFVEAAIVLGVGIFSQEKKVKHVVKEACIAMFIALYGALTLSDLIGRNRPFIAEEGVIRLIPSPLSMHAFPSAHASAAFALAFALCWVKPRVGVVLLLCAAGVSFGRVAVGVHYPTDVLAGVLVGLIAVCIVRLLHAAIRRTSVYREHRHG